MSRNQVWLPQGMWVEGRVVTPCPPIPWMSPVWANQGVSGCMYTVPVAHACPVCVRVCVSAHVCQGGSCWGSDLSLSARTAGWGEGLLPEHLCVSPDFHAHLRAT